MTARKPPPRPAEIWDEHAQWIREHPGEWRLVSRRSWRVKDANGLARRLLSERGLEVEARSAREGEQIVTWARTGQP